MEHERTMDMRRMREGASDGKLHVALMWNDIADLDLHVTAPSGETVCHKNMRSRCGGHQDVDMNVHAPLSTEPVENIYWENPPPGPYQIHV
eukprot:CAMPEP_0170173762 /NCGR_PEP_ID=MMETSP0040_2-20121228/7028_1 /TAXON_ID=641309 /ORGANISM="Lotharella oceanica, Strain CCMP622" /LENGTH=90 /DNA_ID=CAMNT_0010415091 /DNA_START=38 /DNA_END=307 /DNA_ORIENTATION=+